MSARPGKYVVSIPFNWNEIGLTENPGQEVRVTPDQHGKARWVFLGNSRMGVLVALGEYRFTDVNAPTFISERILLHTGPSAEAFLSNTRR